MRVCVCVCVCVCVRARHGVVESQPVDRSDNSTNVAVTGSGLQTLSSVGYKKLNHSKVKIIFTLSTCIF
jgi:hypothetical protein